VKDFMTTLNGLPAHILLVHAIVVLLPLAALLLVLCALWPAARRKLAGPNALLSLIVVVLVPITTDAGEWLEQRVASTPLVRDHVALGDTALFVAIPVAVLALVVWWRHREASVAHRAITQGSGEPDQAQADIAPADSPQGKSRFVPSRTFLAPASAVVTVVVTVLSVLAAGAAIYDIYRIGDSGAQATWQGQISSAPVPGEPGR
jgi:p-aminobenzoyl-glutamate transporter AbgT